jgi:tryptophan synthase alpha subunit
MTYYNILYKYGVKKFCKRAKEVGCYGLIVPDIPIDEEEEERYIQHCLENDLHPIQIVSPLTPDDRLEKIGKAASGFVYCVSRLGTTGAQTELDEKLEEYLSHVRQYIKVPLALGFGISTREHVAMAGRHADIVVMGSKIIDVMNASKPSEKISAVENFLKALFNEWKRDIGNVWPYQHTITRICFNSS